MIFRKTPNERCLNGLQFDYFLSRPCEPEWLVERFQNVLGPGLFRLEERLGERRIIRLILQFVMELRLGERDDGFTLIHRMSANAERREVTERLLEQELHAFPEAAS